MMLSILSNKPQCYVCGMTYNLHRHHIFYGTANRRKSDEFGAWVYLCARHHNMSDDGVHFNKELDLMLKQQAQEAWEERFGRREDFIRIFGKSYL